MAKTNIRGAQIADGSNGVDLAVDVTGVLPTTNGGTGASSITGAGIVDTTSAQSITGQKTLTDPKINRLMNTSGGTVATVNTASGSNPQRLSLDSSFGSNTPGSPGNLKIQVYDDGNPIGTGNCYGIGLSGGKLEIQSGVNTSFYVNGGLEALYLDGTGVVQAYDGAGLASVVTFTALKLTQSSAYTVPAGYGQYLPDVMEISAGVAYEIGAGSVLEIG